ncbi:MAG TPA: arginase family protein [Polyangiales bacterium]
MEDGLRPTEQYVVWPDLLRIEREDDALTLYNPGHGTSIDVEDESRALVEAVLAGFAQPTTLAAFQRAHRQVPRELLVLLVRSGIVVAARELPFLQHGFLRPTPHPVGASWAWSDLPEAAVPGTWVTVGVPVDFAAAGVGGARLGPAEIRKVVNGSLLTGQGDVVDHDLSRLYPAFAPQLADLGDVEPDGARLDHVGARLGKVVGEVLDHGMRPLVLGGDHSVTHYVLEQLIARGQPFGLLHFDAHADMGPSRTLSHANVFQAAIASECVARIVQIGLRGIERMSPFARRAACPKRSVVSAREARQGRALELLEALPKELPYYLSFDIDCIDGTVARETGMPLFGGLDVPLATELVDYVARHFTLLGADFVEVSGPPSAINAAATIAAGLLARCVMGDSPFQPLGTDVYVI